MTQDEITDAETEVLCSDFDDDCEGVENKVRCWLYNPSCGICPFLKQKGMLHE